MIFRDDLNESIYEIIKNINSFYLILCPLCFRNACILFSQNRFILGELLLFSKNYSFANNLNNLFFCFFLAISKVIVNKYFVWKSKYYFCLHFFYFYDKLFHIKLYFLQVIRIYHALKQSFKRYKDNVFPFERKIT
jgi:hypothetical protein